MEAIRGIKLSDTTRQEVLPDFAPDFPYRFSLSEPGQFPGGKVPWHWHPALELFYLQSGTLTYETPAGTRTFGAGSGGLVNGNVLHGAYVRQGEQATQLIHLFEPSLLGGSLGSRIEQKYLLPVTADASLELLAFEPGQPQQDAILEKLKASFALPRDAFGYELRLRSALSDLWLDILSLPRPEKAERRGSDGPCKAMMAFLHEHAAEPLHIGQLAAAGCCSEREVYRTFQTCLHTTPLNYLQNLRLQNACTQLACSGKSITEIAADCGFASLSYFGKVFRRTFGCTPAGYRAKWQDRTMNGR